MPTPPRERLNPPTTPAPPPPARTMPAPTPDPKFAESLAEYERLRTNITIDKHALDDEFVGQPGKYLEVSEAKSLAISYRDESKYNLDLVKGTQDNRMRELMIPAEGRKPTETQIEAAVINTMQYQDAKEELMDWEALVAKWWGLQEAMQQRGRALEKLSNLWAAGYWQQSSGGAARITRGEIEADRVRAQRGAAIAAGNVHHPDATQE